MDRVGGTFRGFVMRRIAMSIFLLWGVGTILFLSARLVPGDVVSVMLGEEASADPEARATIVARYNLDAPLYEQYITHFTNMLRGDFGLSMRTGGEMSEELARTIPASLELGLVAAIIATLIGIFLGTWAAIKRGRFVDQVIRVVSLAGISMPLFWIALIVLWVFNYRLDIAPGVGRLPPGAEPPPTVTGAYTVDSLIAGDIGTFSTALSHLILPAMVLGLYTMTMIARFARSSVLEVLNEDFIEMAHAKGLSAPRVLIAHILRAAFVPIVTVLGLMFGAILAGGVLVEEIFNYPGIGRLMFRSATFLDMPGMIAIGMVVGAIYIILNFVVDLLYGVIDPRIRVTESA